MASDVKWIKLTTDMFDNRKIKHLRKLPEGNNIVLIWVMLLTMAGRCNASGMIFLTENIPYTPKMLADELEFEENTVRLALDALKRLNMIITDGDFFMVAGWQDHQNIEGMEKIREQTRLRVAKHRDKQRMVLCNVTGNVTVTDGNALDIDKEIEIDTDKDIKRINYQEIVDMYHSICLSYPRIKSLSESRKKAIKARLKQYTVDNIREVFQKAEASDFMKGKNDTNWSANFDWMMKDANMAKILDGNYDNRGQKKSRVNVGLPEGVEDPLEGLFG